MTAALQLDLTQTLCRYMIDPASGALKINPPSPNNSCGQPGSPPGNQTGTSSGGTGSSTANSQLVPTLPSNAVGQKPSAQKSGGLIGVPAVPGR
jgi:phospholipid/cholesterol/gamma-HCH transport system substrate-binding protein